MTKPRAFWILVAVVLLCVLGVSYPSLRMRHVISKIESAKTPQEERAAFRLAREYYPFIHMERVRPPRNTWPRQGDEFVLKFSHVWPFTAQQYSARLILLADTNLEYLTSTVLNPIKY